MHDMIVNGQHGKDKTVAPVASARHHMLPSENAFLECLITLPLPSIALKQNFVFCSFEGNKFPFGSLISLAPSSCLDPRDLAPPVGESHYHCRSHGKLLLQVSANSSQSRRLGSAQ